MGTFGIPETPILSILLLQGAGDIWEPFWGDFLGALIIPTAPNQRDLQVLLGFFFFL